MASFFKSLFGLSAQEPAVQTQQVSERIPESSPEHARPPYIDTSFLQSNRKRSPVHKGKLSTKKSKFEEESLQKTQGDHEKKPSRSTTNRKSSFNGDGDDDEEKEVASALLNMGKPPASLDDSGSVISISSSGSVPGSAVSSDFELIITMNSLGLDTKSSSNLTKMRGFELVRHINVDQEDIEGADTDQPSIGGQALIAYVLLEIAEYSDNAILVAGEKDLHDLNPLSFMCIKSSSGFHQILSRTKVMLTPSTSKLAKKVERKTIKQYGSPFFVTVLIPPFSCVVSDDQKIQVAQAIGKLGFVGCYELAKSIGTIHPHRLEIQQLSRSGTCLSEPSYSKATDAVYGKIAEFPFASSSNLETTLIGSRASQIKQKSGKSATGGRLTKGGASASGFNAATSAAAAASRGGESLTDKGNAADTGAKDLIARKVATRALVNGNLSAVTLAIFVKPASKSVYGFIGVKDAAKLSTLLTEIQIYIEKGDGLMGGGTKGKLITQSSSSSNAKAAPGYVLAHDWQSNMLTIAEIEVHSCATKGTPLAQIFTTSKRAGGSLPVQVPVLPPGALGLGAPLSPMPSPPATPPPFRGRDGNIVGIDGDGKEFDISRAKRFLPMKAPASAAYSTLPIWILQRDAERTQQGARIQILRSSKTDATLVVGQVEGTTTQYSFKIEYFQRQEEVVEEEEATPEQHG